MNTEIKELVDMIKMLTTELEQLKNENVNKSNEIENLKKAVHELYDANSELILHLSKLIGDVTRNENAHYVTRARCDNAKFEILDPRGSMSELFYPYIVSRKETVAKIYKERKSIARFGDGEFSAIAKKDRHKFQKIDSRLSERLNEVLNSKHPNLLIAIADNYGRLDKFTEHAADGIRFYMTEDARELHQELLDGERIYYNAYMSRPYVMYQDNDTDMPKQRFGMLKKIWENRTVIVVEGEKTRTGVGNDLLGNAKEVKRIIAPAVNSFDRYDDILKASLEQGEEDILYLIAMGPSAGILAYDLTVKGYQAVDIGHIDLEYEWFLAGKGVRVPIPHKYNNEYKDGDQVVDVDDPVYEAQIICRFD